MSIGRPARFTMGSIVTSESDGSQNAVSGLITQAYGEILNEYGVLANENGKCLQTFGDCFQLQVTRFMEIVFPVSPGRFLPNNSLGQSD